MIYILAISTYDLSTDHVVEWLNHYNIEHIRLNIDELEDESKFNIKVCSKTNTNILVYKNHIIDVNAKNVIWYRRKSIERNDFEKTNLDEFNLFQLISYRNNEANRFMQYFYSLFGLKTIWMDWPYIKLNKIDVLLNAKELGLTIPEFVITNRLGHLKNLKSYISKPMSDGIQLFFKE